MNLLKTPKTRIEFENHVNIIAENAKEIYSGIPSIRLVRALRVIRHIPNYRCSFLTINEQARLFINSQATFRSIEYQELNNRYDTSNL